MSLFENISFINEGEQAEEYKARKAREKDNNKSKENHLNNTRIGFTKSGIPIDNSSSGIRRPNRIGQYKESGIFESVQFLNESSVGAFAVLLGYCGLLLAAAVYKRIEDHKAKKNATHISKKEFDEIMRNFKVLAKDLDTFRNKITNSYKWISDANDGFELKDKYFNVFKDSFNKGKIVTPYYSIIFEERDSDNRDYNIDRTISKFLNWTEQFCKSHGFEKIENSDFGHTYYKAKNSNGFIVRCCIDTEFLISIEYDKSLIKEEV